MSIENYIFFIKSKCFIVKFLKIKKKVFEINRILDDLNCQSPIKDQYKFFQIFLKILKL